MLFFIAGIFLAFARAGELEETCYDIFILIILWLMTCLSDQEPAYFHTAFCTASHIDWTLGPTEPVGLISALYMLFYFLAS